MQAKLEENIGFYKDGDFYFFSFSQGFCLLPGQLVKNRP